MKNYYLSLAFLCIAVYTKAQTVSFYINGHADDVPLFMASKLVTDIKAGNKIVLLTLTASDEGKGTAVNAGASSPFYLSCEKALMYATKFSYDIAINNAIAVTPQPQAVNINGHNINKYIYKSSINYFLRLPDGGSAGAGYAQTGNVSLQKLYTGAISSISAIDGSATYTGWNDLLNTINTIISIENGANATYINTPSINTVYNPSENSDHYHTGLAAQNAISTFTWAGINEFIGNYSSSLPANLNSADFLNNSGIYAVYNYSIIETNNTIRYTIANKAYLPMDYYNVLKVPNSCSIVSGLNTTNIAGSAATINWAGVAGSTGYDVDYKPNNSNAWISGATSTAATNVPIGGLTPATLYDYRVRRKCGTSYSAYTTAQFITTATGCNPPASLGNNNITVNSATVLWAPVSGAVNYQVEYKLAAATTWAVYGTAITTTSVNITGLSASTAYQWRIKSNCSGGATSAYSTAEFTTATPLVCDAPLNPAASSITAISAVLSWSAVAGAANYTVEYKPAASITWLTLSATLSTTNFTVSGLLSNTNYDWRVKANCTNNIISNYTTASFTTTIALTCTAPTNLLASSITNSSAIFTWNTIAGAATYTIEYKPTATTVWTILSAATSSTTIAVNNLSAGISYDWRVKTNCTNGVVSAYTVATFTTTSAATACNKPINLYVTNVTSSKCTLNWDAVAGVAGYEVQFKQYGATTWLTAVSNTTANAYTITGLSYYTIYESRVVANCSNGSTNPSDVFVFLTSCIDFNEPNNSIAQATPFGIGSVLNAQITLSTDVDVYSFTTVAPNTNFTISMFNLPADYNLNLYNSAGQLLATSVNTGTIDEKIVRNTTAAGTYYFSIYGVNGSFDSTQCYVYTVNASSAAMSAVAPVTETLLTEAAASAAIINKGIVLAKQPSPGLVITQKLTAYPQPAADKVTLQYMAAAKSTAAVSIIDVNGYVVQQTKVNLTSGNNYITLNLLKLSSGLYVIKLNDGNKIVTGKLTVAH